MNTTKAYAYLRVSGRSQLQGHGFDRQLEVITTFCKNAGYEIDGVYKEQVSGTKDETERTEFSAMVNAILKNGVRTIVVESLDRLARELRIQEQLVIYVAAKGITLISATTEQNITKAYNGDPMRRAMIQMQGIFAELEKSLLVKKLRKAREQVRVDQGKCEGRKSYTEANPDLLQLIRKLRRKPRSSIKKKLTFDQVAERLNEAGYSATNGKPFTGNTVRGILHRQKKVIKANI
jgi:DNA invertase Pin-like site-specific DNA recombinase